MHIKYNFVLQQVADTYMAVAVGDGAKKFRGLIKLNETGKDIFEKLQQGMTVEQTVDALLLEYNATREQLQTEVDKIVAKLKSENLIVED